MTFETGTGTPPVTRAAIPEQPTHGTIGRPRTNPWIPVVKELVSTMPTIEGQPAGRSVDGRAIEIPTQEVRDTLRALYRAGTRLGVSVKSSREEIVPDRAKIVFWTEGRYS